MVERPASALAQDILRNLVRERQELRSQRVGDVILEANRRAIVFWQQRLSAALLAEHGVGAAS